MLKILFMTAPSTASTLLSKRIKDTAKSDGLEIDIEIASEEEVFARANVDNFDMVLVCPTLRFLFNRPEKMHIFGDTPVAVIQTQIYGSLDARAILSLIAANL